MKSLLRRVRIDRGIQESTYNQSLQMNEYHRTLLEVALFSGMQISFRYVVIIQWYSSLRAKSNAWMFREV